MIRSVLEGVAFGLKDSLEIIKNLGVPIQQVRASGGARSAVWRQIQADINGCVMVTVNVSEGAAYGAALLAGAGTGVYSSVEEACNKTIKVTDNIKPDKAKAHVYEGNYRIYRSLYGKLKDSFKEISGI